MKREEEIELAWRKKAVQSNHKYDEKSFKEAVEWADQHPKRYNQDELCDIQLEMMRQRDKRLIAKACKWIEENKHLYKELSFGSVSTDWNKFIREFKKAMEG